MLPHLFSNAHQIPLSPNQQQHLNNSNFYNYSHCTRPSTSLQTQHNENNNSNFAEETSNELQQLVENSRKAICELSYENVTLNSQQQYHLPNNIENNDNDNSFNDWNRHINQPEIEFIYPQSQQQNHLAQQYRKESLPSIIE